MTRYIAILTLALTAALSADEAYATDTCHVDEYGTISMAAIAIRTGAHVDGIVYEIDLWDADDLDTLIAIIAIEHGPGVAYGTLRDMGFTEAESFDILGWPVTEGMVLDGWSHEVISPR